jgi:hypothetical protein
MRLLLHSIAASSVVRGVVGGEFESLTLNAELIELMAFV